MNMRRFVDGQPPFGQVTSNTQIWGVPERVPLNGPAGAWSPSLTVVPLQGAFEERSQALVLFLGGASGFRFAMVLLFSDAPGLGFGTPGLGFAAMVPEAFVSILGQKIGRAVFCALRLSLRRSLAEKRRSLPSTANAPG